MPTLCEAAGITLPEGIQGRSLWPLLTGEAYPEAEFASAYAEHGYGGLPYGENEALDPAELVNLYNQPEHAAIQMELLQDMMAWALRTQDPLPPPRKRYVVKQSQRNWMK